MKLLHKVLAPLASLEVQNRYIINGTKDNYLLPEDLLNSAINVLLEQQALKFEETEMLSELKEAIRCCNIPDNLLGSDVVFRYKPWAKVREVSQKYLLEIGFDLQTWEKHEL